MRKTVQLVGVVVALGAPLAYSMGCGSGATTASPGSSNTPDSGGSDAAGVGLTDGSSGNVDGAGGSPSGDSGGGSTCADAAAAIAEIPACYTNACTADITACEINCACDNALATAVTDYFVNNDPAGAATALNGAGTPGSTLLTCLTNAAIGTCSGFDGSVPDDGGGGDGAAAICFDAATLSAEIPACLSTPCASDITNCESNCECENALSTAVSDITAKNYGGAESALAGAGSTGSALGSCFESNITSCGI